METSEGLLEHLTEFIFKHYLSRRGADLEMFQDLLRALFESGIVVGFHLKTMPFDKAFMAARQELGTLCKYCQEEVLPIYTRKRKTLKVMFWWCKNNGVLTFEEVKFGNIRTERLTYKPGEITDYSGTTD